MFSRRAAPTARCIIQVKNHPIPISLSFLQRLFTPPEKQIGQILALISSTTHIHRWQKQNCQVAGISFIYWAYFTWERKEVPRKIQTSYSGTYTFHCKMIVNALSVLKVRIFYSMSWERNLICSFKPPLCFINNISSGNGDYLMDNIPYGVSFCQTVHLEYLITT